MIYELDSKDTIEFPRRRYICQNIEYDWRAQIPAGYTLQPIDESIRGREDLPEDVANLLNAWEEKLGFQLEREHLMYYVDFDLDNFIEAEYS